MSKFKMLSAGLLSLLLSACGSMSLGDTALDTLGVFVEANAIKDCYENGGSRERCEGRP